jgi:hypothetical protein
MQYFSLQNLPSNTANPATATPFNTPNPYLQGVGAYNPNAATMRDLVMNDLITDPSYQFRFGEGQRAIQNRAAAMGKRFSGNMLQALTDYGQDYASQEYGNAYNRLAGLSGTAQTATNSMNNAGMNYANAIGNIQGQIGSAQGNAALAQGQAYSNMANTAGQMFNTINWSNPFGTSNNYGNGVSNDLDNAFMNNPGIF